MAEQNDRPLRGAGFNTDPQTADWDELAFENHNLNERVRGENTDTDDALAIYVQGVSTTTKVFNVQKNGTINSNGSPISQISLSGSTNITLGAAAAAGTGTAALRSDATILAFDATLPQPVVDGSVGTAGTASVAARRDHDHPRTASVSSAGLPALILGTTNVAGGTNFIGVSSRIQLYDGTAPGAMTVGGAAVQGVGSFAARSDHGHAISNLNVALLGGSWGSGPTLTNPQVAATGWASANHAHLAANSGGLITGVTYTSFSSTSLFQTTSATFVDITNVTFSITAAHASNKIRYSLSGNVRTSAAEVAELNILNSTDTVTISGSLTMSADPNYATVNLVGVVVQAASAKTIKAQAKINSGATYNFNGQNSTNTAVLDALEIRSNG